MSNRASRSMFQTGIASFGRRRRARLSHAILESLEKRRLLSGYSGYTFTLAAQPGTNQAAINIANGTYLQDIIFGTTLLSNSQVSNHTLTLGDTLILPDGFVYNLNSLPDDELQLPNLGAAATATESGGAVTSLSLSFAPAGGYTASPTVSIFGGGGAGATGSVTYNSTTGAVTGISLTNGGSGYTAAPTVAILGGAETLTIESAGFAASDISGRFIAATDIGYTAQITGSADAGQIVVAVLSDSHSHSGAAQNYNFDGVEICPSSDTIQIQGSLFNIGPVTSYDQQLPTNFTLDQDYIHGGTPGETSDDISSAGLSGWVADAVELNANYVTVENCQISDIHTPLDTKESHGIAGWNTLGNFTINNNYIESASEGIIFGGAVIDLPSPSEMNNVTITNNYITKNLAWDPLAPQFAGVPMYVKNDLELKIGTNVTISHNLLNNVWLGADQFGEAINLSNIAYPGNPWSLLANVTMTDNVIENAETAVVIAGGQGDNVNLEEGYYNSQIAYNITFSNNFAYNLGGPECGPDNDNYAMEIISKTAPINNLTIENNTLIGGEDYMSVVVAGTNTAVATNFVYANNVVEYNKYGFFGSTFGSNGNLLNSSVFDGLAIINPGSNYSTNPTVTISGGGGSGATAVAALWSATSTTNAGELLYVQITNPGSGYTSAPTISFSGGGGAGAAATAMAPVNGQLRGYDFNGNLIIGGTSSSYPAGTTNSFPSTESGSGTNGVGFTDAAGDEYGISSASPYYASGTGGSVPGINMANLNVPDFPPLDPSAGLVALWNFDEGSGSKTTPQVLSGSGTSLAGTLGSAVTWNTSGIEGDALTFPGGTNTNTGCVTLANQPAVPANVTVMAWIDPANNSGNVSGIVGDGNSEFYLQINSSGNLVADAAGVTVTDTSFDYYSSGNDNKWYLVGFVFNSSAHTLTLYRDGQATASASDTGTISAGGTIFTIGSANGSDFLGSIDDVYMYNTALSGTEQVTGNNYMGFADGKSYNSGTSGFAVTFTGGGGSGAAATAYAENTLGAIDSVIMTNYGSGYTAAPTMSFTNGGGTGALDTAFMSGTQISYLYQQYGPQIQGTMGNGDGDTITTGGTTLTPFTYATDPESGANVTYAWSCLTYPQTGISAPTSSNWDLASPTINFQGSGRYLFQLTATNSFGESASVEVPITYEGFASTNVAFVSPTSINIATNSTQTFTVNGTSIVNLSGIVDQFGNAMPSSGWSWAVSNSPTDGTITTGGVYTSPNSPGTLGSVVQLKYTTLDGITYVDSTASVTVSVTLPGAPSNLIATPGTSSVALKWTDPTNTANVTGYQIWRSTDNATWGSSAYATITGATDSTYTDSAPASGTTYYYKVDAYNSAGDSTAAGMTCGVATVYAYEGFNYPLNSAWNGGGTVPLGFTGNWNVSNSNAASIVSGLSYTNGASTLTNSGKALKLSDSVTAINTLNQSVGASGTTLWVGFLFSSYSSSSPQPLAAELDLGTSTNEVEIGSTAGAEWYGRVVTSSGTYYFTSSATTLSANTTYFVACEIVYTPSTGDVIHMYADPVPGTTPTSAVASVTLPTTATQLTSASVVTLHADQYDAVPTFDEVRLGATYSAVAPDPKVVGGNTSASSLTPSHSNHRRSPFLAVAPSGSTDIVTRNTAATANTYRFYPGLEGSSWQFVNNDSDNTLLASPSGSDLWKGLFN